MTTLKPCGSPHCPICPRPSGDTLSDDVADVADRPDRGAGDRGAGQGAVGHLDFVNVDALPILRIPRHSSRYVILFPEGRTPPEGLVIEVER